MTWECSCGETLADMVELVGHDCDGRLALDGLSDSERSTLLYVESRVVDHGGELLPDHMNHEDTNNLKVFQAAGLLVSEDGFEGRDLRYRVTAFTDDAWDLARDCRRARSEVPEEGDGG